MVEGAFHSGIADDQWMDCHVDFCEAEGGKSTEANGESLPT